MGQNKRLTKEEIQEDKFIDFVLQCYAFLKDNVRTISIVLAVVIVGVFAYIAYSQNQEKKHVEASANYADISEVYKEAEKNYLDSTTPAENEDDNGDDAETDKTTFQDAEENLKVFSDKYSNTELADKARFDYAKTLYYQGKYAEARAQFEQVIKTHKPKNQIYALYAQKAIGNCYEQEGNYEEAISAYDERSFPTTANLAPEIHRYVIANAKYNQALCYEKIKSVEDAKATYKDILDEFQLTIQNGIQQKSLELIKEANEVITVIEDPIDLTAANQLETEESYFDAFVAYTDAIRKYKVEKDISGGLLAEVRQRIRTFEDQATTFIGDVKDARNSEESGFQSTALNGYDRAIEFDKYGLNKDLYDRALLNYDRLTITESDPEVMNEE